MIEFSYQYLDMEIVFIYTFENYKFNVNILLNYLYPFYFTKFLKIDKNLRAESIKSIVNKDLFTFPISGLGISKKKKSFEN